MIRNLVLHTAHGSLHGQLDRPDNPRGLILVARAHRLPEDATLASSLEALNFAVLSMDLLTVQELQFVDATQNVPRRAAPQYADRFAGPRRHWPTAPAPVRAFPRRSQGSCGQG